MDNAQRAALDGVADDADFSGVIQVRRGDEVLYERARGRADRAHAIPITLDTQLGMASGSKGFTALATMALVADGALTLDTSVRAVLGDVLELINPAVTVEHLLAHTSGIGDYLDEDDDGDISDYVLAVPVHELATTPDFLAVLRGYPMKFEPGARFSYCNGGFVVLALVIEAVSGSTFHDVVADRVCRPAGMSSTAFLRSDQLPGSAAIGYVPDGDGWRTNAFHLPVRGTGDGGAYTTVSDMAAFWRALIGGRIVPPDLVAEMTRPRNDTESESRRYGLGFWLGGDRDTVMLDGFDAGVSFRSTFDPASELLYTVIANTSAGAWPLVKALDALAPDLAPGV